MSWPELKILVGKHQGRSIPLSVHEFVVGRDDDCNLRPISSFVSGHHCVFIVDGYSVRLRDLGSANGTFVNGDRVDDERYLRSGDRVSIGLLVFEVHISECPARSEWIQSLNRYGMVPNRVNELLAKRDLEPPPKEPEQSNPIESAETVRFTIPMQAMPPADSVRRNSLFGAVREYLSWRLGSSKPAE